MTVPEEPRGGGLGPGFAGETARWRWAVVGLVVLCHATVVVGAARVVVVSPHNLSIRHEFGTAFARWHERETGQPAAVEWRDLGGTADTLRFVLSEFTAKPEGIGIDCFFGSGPEHCLVLASRGFTQV